jgi:hypothetical protein
VAGYAACAYPELDYRDEDDTATSMSVAGSGGAAAASGGMGGAPACDLYNPGSCGRGQKCAVVDVALGAPAGLGCVEAGPRAAWTRCLANEECAEGLWCEDYTAVCKPICANGNQCGTGAQCVEARRGDVPEPVPIPGLRVCTSHCDPSNGMPCDDAQGLTTCYYDTDLVEFDCASSQGLSSGAVCDHPIHACDRGLICVFDEAFGDSFCYEWCTPPDQTQATCTGNLDSCYPFFSPTIEREGTPYGACAPF